MDFSHVDDSDPGSKQAKLKPSVEKMKTTATAQTAWNPERLGNGKWACNHKCKDKTA